LSGEHPLTITICSSANFYKHVAEIADRLEAQGLKVLMPITAKEMRDSGNFDVGRHRTWLQNPEDYHKKTALMRQHFAEVEKGDAILVVNDEKHGVENYIGGNVLMEMTLAFYLHKPIFLLNGVPQGSMLEEEIIGVEPVLLAGRLESLHEHLAGLKRG
jgi:hypothetical protein